MYELRHEKIYQAFHDGNPDGAVKWGVGINTDIILAFGEGSFEQSESDPFVV